jgi:antitoxin (DNA-binding transcriptional repressor) of toxin-antitoxin stability system
MVKAGQRVAVTERGTLVAYLVPVEASGSLLDRLTATGEYQPPAGQILDLLPPPPVPENKRPFSQVVEELRDEERW